MKGGSRVSVAAVAAMSAAAGAGLLLAGAVEAHGIVSESPSPSPNPTPTASPSASPFPPVDGGHWTVNGATVKLAGSLAGQLEMGGNTFKAAASATKQSWTTTFSTEGGGPVTLNGTVTGPPPTIDATVNAFGVPVNIQGTPGEDLSVSFGRKPVRPRAVLSGVQLLAAVKADDSPAQVAATVGSDWVRGFIAFTIVGWLLILVAPGLKRRAEVANRSMPFGRLGLGVVLALDIPLASIVIFAIGLPLGLWWLGLVGLLGFAVLAVAGYAFSGLQAGRLILDAIGFPGLGSFAAVPIGVAVIVLVGLLPYIGTLASLLIMVYGLGSMLYSPRQPAPAPSAAEELAARKEEVSAPGGRPVVE